MYKYQKPHLMLGVEGKKPEGISSLLELYQPKFDPREALDRVSQSLELQMAVRPFNNRISDRGQERARMDDWYRKGMATIRAFEDRYKEQLEIARRTGAIEESDYFKAMGDLSFPTSPFRKLIRELKEVYSRETGNIEPQSAWPETYDPVTHFRTSPNLKRWRDSEGVWWISPGLRDEVRSPKKDLTRIIFHND